MYNIYIDESAYANLQEWTLRYKRYVVNCPAVAPRFKIILKIDNMDNEAVLFVDKTKYSYKYRLKSESATLAKGKIEISQNKKIDYNNFYELNFDELKKYYNDFEKTKNFDFKAFAQKIMPDTLELFCNAFSWLTHF